MKILHCCLAAFYIDNYGYQENILPKMHQLQGHKVQIVASTETYIENKKLGYIEAKSYFTPENIPITRIPYLKGIPHFINKKLRIYSGLTKLLNNFKPDIIFLHDVQFLGVWEIKKYAKRNNVIIYADCHTDFLNSAKNWVSKNTLHKIIYRRCAKAIEPYTKKFYGVLPLRVDFLKDVYKIPVHKLDLLVLGADDTQFDLSKKESIRKNIRNHYNINENDFLVISGGKIDRRKNIHILMNAFREIQRDDIKLIVFGTANDDLKEEISQYKTIKNIVLIDWLDTKTIYDLLMTADLGFFPGTHSVLWEQSVGIGLPCVFKKWEGIEHVNVGGNCLFIEDISIINIKKTILKIADDKKLHQNMLKAALGKGIPRFSYSKIAKYAIEQ
jgi:1,2-diacylglycerol 3-alpha-glucosyltransferase